MFHMMRRYLLLFILTFNATYSSGQTSHNTDASYFPIRQNGFFFTSPLLDCEYQHTFIPPFEEELKEFIEAAKTRGLANEVSVYFKQLENGYGFGIDADKKYHPASLMKVANMMYIVKLSEKDSALLESKYVFKHNNEIVDTESVLVEGESYSIKRYMIEMIVRSDNQAMTMIHTALEDRQLWKHVFSDLGIELKTNASSSRLMSPKTYTILFQVLYNATYLTKENSEKCLRLLSRTRYKDGILYGIADKRISAANKFGFYQTEVSKELHETAIVYLNDSPYILSIMTEGKDENDLRSVVINISQIVYSKCKAAMTGEINNADTSKAVQLISPLIDCKSSVLMKSFVSDLENVVSIQQNIPSIDKVAIYVSQLETGRSFTINGDLNFPAAGIMEVAHLITVLRSVEQSPQFLNTNMEFTSELAKRELDENTCLIVGQKYTPLELIGILIRTSDKNALELLNQSPLNGKGNWSYLFKRLGLSPQADRINDSLRLRAQDVSLFYRILYNATFLNREDSELALHLISSLRLKQGISASVPSHVPTSVKRGVRIDKTGEIDKIVLNESGIVYMDDRPYLLVVMTEGSSKQDQMNCITAIAKEVALKISGN